MKKVKLLALATALAVVSNVFVVQSVLAQDSETVSNSITSGSLTITAPSGDTSLSGAAVSTTSGAVTGTVSGITVTDTRGTGAGWTASSTTTHLGLQGGNAQTRITSGSVTTSNLAVTGTYDGSTPASGYEPTTGVVPSGEYSIEVNTASAGIPTAVTVTHPDGTGSAPTVTDGVFTVNGLTVTYNNSGANWVAGDTAKVRVDHFGYTVLTNTPSNLSAVNSASTTGLTLQSADVYVDGGTTSASRADLVAAANAGMGSYTYDLGLSQVVHANPMAGSYVATITLSAA